LFKRFLAHRKSSNPECGGYLQHSKRHKGETMKNHCVRILTAFFAFAALAITAKAQVPDQLIVKIPYEFVAAGQTLPAGTYRISRATDNNDRVLAITSFESRSAVLVLTGEIADKTRHGQTGVDFQQVGDQHLLSKIETADHVFTIPVPKSAVLEAQMKMQSSPSGSMSLGKK
jgi:hypothetical protein